MKLQSCLLLLLLVRLSDAWMTPSTNNNSPVRQRHGTATTATARKAFSTRPESKTDFIGSADEPKTSLARLETKGSSVATPPSDLLLGAATASLVGLAALTASPEAATAAATATESSSSILAAAGGSISSALFAYGHYFSIIAIVGILFTERLTLENGPNLTEDEENRLAIADALYGVIGLLIVYTGYYRLSDPALGKGTYFYIHEPVFWLKMAMVGVLGACSLFNTTKIIQRSVERATTADKSSIEPMSEALCDRMKSICNAEITGILFIPMAATFMARGIGYNESIPWQAEAGVAALLFLGLGFKYVREALTFEERLLQAEKETTATW